MTKTVTGDRHSAAATRNHGAMATPGLAYIRPVLAQSRRAFGLFAGDGVLIALHPSAAAALLDARERALEAQAVH